MSRANDRHEVRPPWPIVQRPRFPKNACESTVLVQITDDNGASKVQLPLSSPDQTSGVAAVQHASERLLILCLAFLVFHAFGIQARLLRGHWHSTKSLPPTTKDSVVERPPRAFTAI